MYVISYFRSTHEILFSKAMIHYVRHLMSHHLIYLSILSRWIILISYSESCAFSSIILHKQFCECQTTGWQQKHMWLSYRCIFLSYHMIGEWSHIHLLYFSEFRDLVPTLVDPINFITRTSNIKNSWRIFYFFNVCSLLNMYIFGITKLFVPTNKIISTRKLQV